MNYLDKFIAFLDKVVLIIGIIIVILAIFCYWQYNGEKNLEELHIKIKECLKEYNIGECEKKYNVIIN